MSTGIPANVINNLIARLPRKQQHNVLKNCEPVNLVFGSVLCKPEQPVEHVYFPLTGFISLQAAVDSRPPMEVGLIGNEGMLGATLMLDVADAPLQAAVQGAGTALHMSKKQFLQVIADNPALSRLLNLYLYIMLTQLSKTATCAHFHEVGERLARWLLMIHDRAHADYFHLTHQFLADMLGVQRSAVTIAAGVLQQRELISYTRGEINILNRNGLEAASCTCYDTGVRDYERILA
ncbi:MAG: Crp/Fnr family transcriptional regulator [Gammaproteobacteria bacterium]|nr:Crp/Fnr family transcriptional regulator [Gammaproteobacteria bacterium]